MKKQVLYIAPTVVDVEMYGRDGICKKIHQQCKAFSEMHEVTLVGYSDNNLAIYRSNGKKEIVANNGKHRRLFLYEYARGMCAKDRFDTVYIRYARSDFLFVQMIKSIKTNTGKIIIEIPTYPYKAEMMNDWHNRLMYISDSIFSNRLKRYVDYIATFSKDEKIFGIPCLNIQNGVIVDDFPVRTPIESDERTIHSLRIVSVSSMHESHGYDRMIRGIDEFYRKGDVNNRKVYFDMVGDGPSRDKYEKLVKDLDLGTYVRFYGYQSGAELDMHYNVADIAVGALGFHRIGIHNGSPIKTREALAVGLPIIVAGSVDLIEDDGYVLTVPEDESPISIVDVFDFAEKVYAGKDRMSVAYDIHAFAKRNCDMKVSMNAVLNVL